MRERTYEYKENDPVEGTREATGKCVYEKWNTRKTSVLSRICGERGGFKVLKVWVVTVRTQEQ